MGCILKLDSDKQKFINAIAEVLKKNKSITSFRIGNDIGNEGAKTIAGGLKENKNTKLTELNLNANNIDPVGAAAIAEALKNNTTLTTTLTELNLNGNNIGPDGAAAIAEALKEHKKLKYLYLNGNNIGNDGAAAIGEALKKNETLIIIEMKSNNIGPVGVDAIAEGLKENKTLKVINLCFNAIGGEIDFEIENSYNKLKIAIKENDTISSIFVG